MITDLIQISRLGEKKRGENERFRKHLKSHEFAERRFRRIAEEIEEQIDCTQCANCCRVATVTVSERDAEKLAAYLGISLSKFNKDYTTEDQEEGVILRR